MFKGETWDSGRALGEAPVGMAQEKYLQRIVIGRRSCGRQGE